MEFDISQIDPRYHFKITGVSFIGAPQNETMLFITRKVQRLLKNIEGKTHCLVFAERGLEIDDAYQIENCFVMTDDPQMEYAKLAVRLQEEERKNERDRKYRLTDKGCWLGENVSIGKGTVVEPGCRIGHDVVIGKNAYIGFGSSIYHAEIGDDFSCLDHTSIGIDAFYFTEGEAKFRIPSFGKVIIGNNVDLSSNVVIERGFNHHTMIHDHVKIDSNVCLGHDVSLQENVFVTSGASIAGLVNVGKNVYIGMNAAFKQRLSIGDDAMIGMGSVVIANVKEGLHVFGNPAVKYGI